MVRESDLTGIGDLLPGAQQKVHAWPPEELAPGITLQRRAVNVRDPKSQEVKAKRTYLEPVVLDSRLYYAHLALKNYRPEDDKLCRSCKGAGYIRHGELTPGRPGFGAFMVCPRWDDGAKRCQ